MDLPLHLTHGRRAMKAAISSPPHWTVSGSQDVNFKHLDQMPRHPAGKSPARWLRPCAEQGQIHAAILYKAARPAHSLYLGQKSPMLGGSRRKRSSAGESRLPWDALHSI